MAGLGEACSHIASLLFAVIVSKIHLVRLNHVHGFHLPSTMKNVAYVPISDINFTAPATKRKYSLETRIVLPLPPSKEKIASFELSQTGKPALLSIL